MENPVLTQLLENKYTLLVIPCGDRVQRSLLHRYVEQKFPTLGSRSFQHPDRPFEDTVYRLHDDCDDDSLKDRWVEVTYRKGSLENNQDESYSGICKYCGDAINWEPNYDDDYESTLIKSRGNMLLIGFVLRNMRKTRVYHTKLSDQEILWCENFLTKDCSLLQVKGEGFMSDLNVQNLKQLLEWVCEQVVQ